MSARPTLSAHDAAMDAGDVFAIIDGNRRLTWAQVAKKVRAMTMPSRSHSELDPSISTRSALAIWAGLSNRTPLVLRSIKRRNVTPIAAGSLPKGSVALETSGSHAEPTLVVHRREAIVAHAAASAEALGSIPSDRWLVCLPLLHVSGLGPLVRALYGRRGVILEPQFDAQRIGSSIHQNQATLVSLVPTMLRALLETDFEPPRHLRAVLVGGATSPPELLDQARSRGLPIVDAYGMTETFSHVALDGRLLAGVEGRLEPDGTLAVRTPTSVTWPEWLRTGDRAVIDDDASPPRITILGRADDVIISGGENVSPARVERSLRAQRGIGEAAVVGIPDERWGQLVAAVVTPTARTKTDEQVTPIDFDAIDQALRDSLSSFERPRRYLVVQSLPRLASGKLDRRRLVTLFLDRAETLP